MKTKIFLTGLVLMAITVFANGQDPAAKQVQGNGRGNGQCGGRCNGTGKGVAFADANKDGVCDNLGNRTATVTGNKGNGNGRCNGQGQGRGNGKGRNFVDANKNGVCDTSEASTNK